MRTKAYLEDFFGAALAEEPIKQTLGLKVVFNECVDFSSFIERRRNENEKTYHHSALLNLVDELGILSFENAMISADADSHLSGNYPGIGLAMQDVFHRDFSETITILYKRAAAQRDVPTDYALATDVRQAIRQLDRHGLSDEVVSALDIMQGAEYFFSLSREEIDPSVVVQYNMPEFGEKIFELLPHNGRLRKEWMSEKPELVIHSNRPNNIVHGRITGSGSSNVLRGMIIHP